MAKGHKTKIDWRKAKLEYVSNPELSMEQVAKKYKVAPVHLRDKAAKGKWTEARTKYLQETYDRTLEKLISEGAKNRADMIRMALDVMTESFKVIKKSKMKPKDHKDAVEAMKKMAETVSKFLPTEMRIQVPAGKDLPQEFQEWYIRVAKEFAPGLLKEDE